MAFTYGSRTISVRPVSCGALGSSFSLLIVAMRTRNVSNSGVGVVSSGVRNKPRLRAREPQLLRLVSTLKGIASTIPAHTGTNHQNIEGASHQISVPQTTPM